MIPLALKSQSSKDDIKDFNLIHRSAPLYQMAKDTSSFDWNRQSIMISKNPTTPFVEYNTTIFCKFEHKLKMSSRFPVKMRLGEVGYVDRLEGKK